MIHWQRHLGVALLAVALAALPSRATSTPTEPYALAYQQVNHSGATGGRVTPYVLNRFPAPTREGYFIAFSNVGMPSRADGEYVGLSWEIYETYSGDFRLYGSVRYPDGTIPGDDDDILEWWFMPGIVNQNAWHVLEVRSREVLRGIYWDCYCDGSLYWTAWYPYPSNNVMFTALEVLKTLGPEDYFFMGRNVWTTVRLSDGSWRVVDASVPRLQDVWAAPGYSFIYNRPYHDYEARR